MTQTEVDKAQALIMADPCVARILSLRLGDGWLGGSFHGKDEPESGIRYLMEKGLGLDHPVVTGALQAIIDRGESFDRGCLERVGKHLDRLRLGGSRLIRACVFAYAGAEDYDFVREAEEEALFVFRAVLRTRNMDGVCREYRGKLVFREGAVWPCAYHLRLLAHTEGWRTSDNTAMLAGAFTRLAELSPIPAVKVLHKGQIIAPASVFMNDFNSDMEHLTAAEWMMWFHRMEMLARLGIVPDVRAFSNQVQYVQALRMNSSGLFPLKINHRYFHDWGAYSGLALENSWRTAAMRENDLTFRCLLIESLARK